MGTQLQKSYDDAEELRNTLREALDWFTIGTKELAGNSAIAHDEVVIVLDKAKQNAEDKLVALIHSREIEAEKRGHKDGYYHGVNDFSGWFMDASLAAQRHPILPEVAKDLLDNYQPPIYRPLKEQTEGEGDEQQG